MPLSNLHPYLPYSLKLAAKPRRGGGNMFRHQMETLAILLEYSFTNPVLLKASLIHDLIEDGQLVGFHEIDEIQAIDEDGAEVLALVKEVSQQVFQGVKEAKGEFLLRIMLQGSEQAKVLKLADRISNLSTLPLAGDIGFIENYISETKEFIMPYAGKINPAMAQELQNRIESTLKTLQNGHIR
jgi:(p)ppGpp synthase/HD superfamily hydrolase